MKNNEIENIYKALDILIDKISMERDLYLKLCESYAIAVGSPILEAYGTLGNCLIDQILRHGGHTEYMSYINEQNRTEDDK